MHAGGWKVSLLPGAPPPPRQRRRAVDDAEGFQRAAEEQRAARALLARPYALVGQQAGSAAKAAEALRLLGDPNAALLAKPTLVPDLPPATRDALGRAAQAIFDKLSAWLAFMTIALYWSVLHQATLFQSQIPGSPVASCFIHSASMIVLMTAGLVLQITVLVWREAGAQLPQALEIATDIFSIVVGILVASAAGTYDFDESTLVRETCSNVVNPTSGLGMFLADTAGLMSLLRSVTVAWSRPFSCGAKRLTGWASALVVVTVAVLAQFLLLDRVVLPLVNKAIAKDEENGDPLDALRELLFPNATENA